MNCAYLFIIPWTNEAINMYWHTEANNDPAVHEDDTIRPAPVKFNDTNHVLLVVIYFVLSVLRSTSQLEKWVLKGAIGVTHTGFLNCLIDDKTVGK